MSEEKKDKFQLDVRDLMPTRDAKGGVGRISAPSPRQTGGGNNRGG